jgi:receptor-binding and translocation channel-forming TcA subunit of Tc toxin
VSEAGRGVQLAALQRNRAQLQQQHYSELLDKGLTDWENAGVAALQAAAMLETAGLCSINTLIEFAGAGAKVASTQAQWFNQEASFERREDEWALLDRLALQDVQMGSEQVQLARDHVSVTVQDRSIAALQADNAETGLEFLIRKFTNTDLYEWMSSVLEGVYRFFLQEATSMSGLAQAQLAFERQDVIPSFIQSDYWEPPQDATDETQDTANQDRRGLTGSARLLRDLYQLDQYAFETDQRKLQLSKTLSLAQLDPYAFQRFRETWRAPVRDAARDLRPRLPRSRTAPD